MRIEFTVPGDPVPKARVRIGRHGAYTPKRTTDYEEKVATHFNLASGRKEWPHPDQVTCPLGLSVSAVVAVPASLTKKQKAQRYGQYHTQVPDADNLLKIIGDGLNGVAFKDDKSIAIIRCDKRWADEGEEAHVLVRLSSL